MSAAQNDPDAILEGKTMGPLAWSCVFAMATALHADGDTMKRTETARLTTGNLSVDYITHSPIGAHPDPSFSPHIPSLETLRRLHTQGLWAYEDYLAWGAIEPVEGQWDWSHHETVYDRLHNAGLVYIPYIWCHIPPVWLRDDPRATLMTNIRDGKKCFMLSIYDPRTIEWYRHFYTALHKQFGDRLEEVYACLLGPYGEGNYPLPYVDFVVKVGDCADSQYWCGDAYALPLFQKAMRRQYRSIAALNHAWGASFKGFSDVSFPEELHAETIPDFTKKPPRDRQRWLDFIHWYHQALIDFSAKSIDVVASIFGRERVATKPGGNCGHMNPVSWGTYNPGFAKMAGKKRIAMQSADSRGAYWADKWTSTAYAYYGVPYRTEAAGGLDPDAFALRTFTDASCGATTLFTYELEKHLAAATESLPLFTGERGQTDIALLAPTTVYYLNGAIMPAVDMGMRLRDLFDYDVLDELLVNDGALNTYRVLIATHCNVIDPKTLAKIRPWVKRGGVLLWAADKPVETIDGNASNWLNDASPAGMHLGKGLVFRTGESFETLREAAAAVASRFTKMPYADGVMDDVWTTVRAHELLLFHRGENPIEKKLTGQGTPRTVTLPPRRWVVVR